MGDKAQEDDFRVKTSIFYKLLLPVVLLVSVAVGITTYYAVKLESKALTQGLIHTATHMADNIASSAESAFWSLNWIYVEKQLHKSHQRKCEKLIYAKLVKPDGEVYLADKKEYYGNIVDTSLLFAKETLLQDYLFTETNERGILLVEPVKIGNDTWYVMLGISLRSIEASVALLIFRNLSLGAIIVLLGVIISFFLFRSISKPIINLAHTVKNISDGDFDQKVIITSTDEVGLLGRSFNQMMDKLNAAREEERKSKREIEEKNISFEREMEERRQAQAALQQSEEKYRNILESIQEGYFEVDLVGNLTFFNEALHRISGYSREEMLGMNNREYTTPETAHKMYKIFGEIYRTGKPAKVIDYEIILKDGSRRVFELSASLKRDIKGKPTGYRGVVRDMTERNQYELQLKRTKEEAEAANRAKSEFLANMSHELRTPLNAIIGFTELVVDRSFGDINDVQEEYLNDVLQSSRHLLALINDILDLSKIEAGKLELKPSNVNLEILLKNSLVMVKEKAMKHGLKLSTKIKKGQNTIHADERKLKQVIYNLISNAVKFTPDGGSIIVSACSLNLPERRMPTQDGREITLPAPNDHEQTNKANFVEVSIKDTGIGISQENLDRIFKSFEQIDGSYNRKYQGTGLGLSLSRDFVELHGGRIWAESEGEDKGSTFRFVIPV